LGAEIIAEGVETVEASQILVDCGVYLMQGYLFSPPVLLEELLHTSSGSLA
jgi:EAL domain-containing protein (putative c-di-GMP-specific phosphodiesterase class I)